MNEKKRHLTANLTDEERWKLRELASKRKQTIRQLLTEVIKNIVKEK